MRLAVAPGHPNCNQGVSPVVSVKLPKQGEDAGCTMERRMGQVKVCGRCPNISTLLIARMNNEII